MDEFLFLFVFFEVLILFFYPGPLCFVSRVSVCSRSDHGGETETDVLWFYFISC